VLTRRLFPRATACILGLVASTLAGCTTTVRSVAPHAGKPSYAIECMKLQDCERVARERCGGSYSTLSQRQNRIPDSELPGLNARTYRNTERSTREYDTWDWEPHGPGIESEEPLPIAEVVVVCG
jgi:hypothetical protein